MFRSRSSRSMVATTASVVLILGLMAGTTSAKKPVPSPTPTPTPTASPTPTPTPTPTPVSDNRDVWFGGAVEGLLDVTPVTAGGAFRIKVSATNEGNQNLSHAAIALGTSAAPNPDDPTSLPDGFTIVEAHIAGCPAVTEPVTGYICEIGALSSGQTVNATFIVETTSAAMDTDIYASFKVAENVNDQGANRNTFFATAALDINAASSNEHSTYLRGLALALSTSDGNPPAGDPQVTRIEVPGATGGLVSIVETDGPTGCPAPCIGQTVSLNVRDGEAFTGSFVRWTMVITGTSAVPSKGGVIHTLDNGQQVAIPNTKSNACSASKTVDCFESYEVDRKTGLTTIVFHTLTNGAARAW